MENKSTNSETASTADKDGEDKVTVSFKCTPKEKTMLIKKAVDEVGTSLAEYCRFKVLQETTETKAPVLQSANPIANEAMNDEEKEAYERLIKKLRAECSDLRFELHTFRSIEKMELPTNTDELNASITSMTEELEKAKTEIERLKSEAIENEDTVKAYLDWSKTAKGKDILSYKSGWSGEPKVDLTKLTDRVLILATLDMGVDQVLPNKSSQSHDKHIDYILKAKDKEAEVKKLAEPTEIK